MPPFWRPWSWEWLVAKPALYLIWGRPPGSSLGVKVEVRVVMLWERGIQGTAVIIAAPPTLFSLRLGHPRWQGRKQVFSIFVSLIYKACRWVLYHWQYWVHWSGLLPPTFLMRILRFMSHVPTAVQAAFNPCTDTLSSYPHKTKTNL